MFVSEKTVREILAEQKKQTAIFEAILRRFPPEEDGELSQLADAAERSAHKLEGVASELDKLDNE